MSPGPVSDSNKGPRSPRMEVLRCAFCGKPYTGAKPVDRVQLEEHVWTCKKHPLAIVMREVRGEARVIDEIINRVEQRCLAADGPVTPTLQEMREDELRELWKALKTIQSKTRRAK